MKNQITLILAITFLSSLSAFAQTKDCRTSVVDAYKSLGETIQADDFSSSEFNELNITHLEFNALTSKQQELIYMQVKPLEVMVEETIQKLNRYIERYVGTYYELYMASEIEDWRKKRDSLRSCSY